MTAAPGEHAHLALALANSRRNDPTGPVDELASAATMRAWLEGHDLGGDETAVDALRELREAVREVLVARIEDRVPDPAAVSALNAAAAAAPAAPRLIWTDSPRATRDHLGEDRARALIAGDAIGLVTGPEHADLRACSAPGCVRLLLKDHPRRHWCSTRCGDRVRASRYYHRHRGASAAAPER